MNESDKAFDFISALKKRLITLGKSNHHIFFDYDREDAMSAMTDFLARINNCFWCGGYLS